MSAFQYNIFISCSTMAGCIASKPFAAAVLAGSVAAFAIAAAIYFQTRHRVY
ncbi:MAG: hypothetical protein ACAH80_00860 [Alphaproteobacteria bacterium]